MFKKTNPWMVTALALVVVVFGIAVYYYIPTKKYRQPPLNEIKAESRLKVGDPDLKTSGQKVARLYLFSYGVGEDRWAAKEQLG